MRAMVFEGTGNRLDLRDVDAPSTGDEDVLINVSACGVCRTDLHILDGELDAPKLPLIPGHEVVGYVVAAGRNVTGLEIGTRVGVPWLGHTCGCCSYCRTGAENLCDAPVFTGYTRDGGYAEFCAADARYVFALPDNPKDTEIAPFMCAGLIGYRSLRFAGDAMRLGIYGFGAAAHILAQIAVWQGREVYAFTRPGDALAQDFARRLGARWAGGSDERSPAELDAGLIFAPVGGLVPAALRSLRKGGVVVCGGIHMSDIPAFPYQLLWGERVVRSVANLTRSDGEEFFELVGKANVRTSVEVFPLDQANAAIDRLRRGELSGAAVLTMS